MPVEKVGSQQQSGWRKDGDDDGASSKAEKKHKKKHKAAPLLPPQNFKSTRTVVVEG